MTKFVKKYIQTDNKIWRNHWEKKYLAITGENFKNVRVECKKSNIKAAPTCKLHISRNTFIL